MPRTPGPQKRGQSGPQRSVVGTDVVSLGSHEPSPLLQMGKRRLGEGPGFPGVTEQVHV